MRIKSILQYFWKLPLCGVGFFIGMALSGALLPALGLQAPAMPEGTDANTVAVWFFLGSLILAFSLSFVAKHLNAKPLLRWMILFALTWGVGAVGMVLESFFFMDTGAVSSISSTLFTILNFLLPSLFISGLAAWLFRLDHPPASTHSRANRTHWFLKTAAALAAYPIVYFTFGLLVQPFIMTYYTQEMYELTAPTWGQLIPLQLGRSVLFLFVSLPVLRYWQGSNRSLWLSLGFSFFILTAFMAVITAYWFPWQMRVFHGMELLADGFAYIGILVLLFRRSGKQNERTNT